MKLYLGDAESVLRDVIRLNIASRTLQAFTQISTHNVFFSLHYIVYTNTYATLPSNVAKNTTKCYALLLLCKSHARIM